MRGLSYKRGLAALTAVAAVAVLFGACGGAGRKVLVEDKIGRLKRDINKVRFAIRTTKTLISRARGERYLPDLYLRQAELFVESAKYHYHLTYERQKDKSGGVVSVQTRLLKNQAIATYRRLLALYPNYRDAAKVRFFMAHEMRELGDYDNMLKAYLELSDKHPKSEYRLEGLLIVGDFYFDKADLDKAEKYYRMVIDSPETRVHAMARYKLAWCKINKADFKGALKLFEGSVRAARKWLALVGGKSGSGSGKGAGGGKSKIDLRREALVDSVYSFTEVHKHPGALKYFRGKADSKTTYLAALNKLGNRYYIKQNWKATAMVYREILSLTGDTEDSLEYAHRLFESVTNGKIYKHGAQDVFGIINVIRRRYHNHTLDAKTRKKLLTTFEKYARDIATRLHDLATAKKEEEKFIEAAQAYTHYLAFFGKSKHAGMVRSNLAEAYYASKRYLKAGHFYEGAAEGQQGKEQRESIYTAAAAYFEALKGKEKLTRLEVTQARAGLRRSGKLFVKLFPKDEQIIQVKFNIARTHYDAGEFDKAIRYFTALVYQFPASKEATVAAHLVLDAYRNQEDYAGVIEAGKTFRGMANLGDSEFRGEVAGIVKGAENRLLDSATLEAADEDTGKSGSEKLEEIALKFKGTDLECKALINAFVTARGAGDVDRVFEIGDKLIRACPTSDKVPDVLATMGKLAVNSFQFGTGAAYLEAAARRKGGSEAADMFKASCTIRVGLGLRRKAEESLNTFLRVGQSASDKGDLAARVAQLHAQAGDWGAVVTLLNKAMGGGASSTQMLYLLGYAYYKKGEYPSAQPFLAQAAAAGRGGSADAREAAAASQFYLGEIAFKDFESIQLSSDLSQLGTTLQAKIQAIKITQAAYVAVVGLRSAVWSVAALGRLSSVDAAAAEALRSLGLPDGLPEEVVKQVKGALESNAAPLAKEAKEALKQCRVTSLKLKVLSEAAKSCLGNKAPTGDPQADVVVPKVTRTKVKGAARLGRKLAKNSKDIPTIAKLGMLHLKAGNPYAARMVLGKGLEARETATLLNLVGVATARLGQHQTALSLFEKALKKDGSHGYARLNQATLLNQYGYTKASRKAAAKIKGAFDFDEGDPRLVSGAVGTLGGGR
jgi:tetratricopeptide (TPR) repeat protein